MSVASYFETMEYGSAPEADGEARAWLARHGATFGHFIAGRFTAPHAGKHLTTTEPATGKTLARIAQGAAADVEAAVGAARTAQTAWAKLGGHGRARHLYALARMLQRHARLFAVLEAIDNGKPIRETRDLDVPLAARHFLYHAGWAQLQEREFADQVPVGVIGQIIPWNFPLLMLAWKIAPALAAGNTVVLKPAEFTSLTALLFAELSAEAGLPPGVLNVVTGDGATGALLVESPGVDKIAFTGSTEVGRLVTTAALGNMKKVSLELGGKSPHIVLPDADPAAVAAAASDGIFFNQGQTCTAGSRLYVHDDIYDDVMSALVDHARRIVVGPGHDLATQMGPLVSARQLDTVTSYVESGLADGAVLVTGGSRPSGLDDRYAGGYFLEPTILTETTHAMRVVQEEIFGPVLVAMRWTDVDDLIGKANDSPYGLAAGLWTNDLTRAHRIAAAIKAGTVWVNCYNLTDPASPFGGYKQSGWGREMGRAVLEQYTETKSVWVNLT